MRVCAIFSIWVISCYFFVRRLGIGLEVEVEREINLYRCFVRFL